MENFKQAYSKSKTWADLENAIKNNLTPSKIEKLINSLETVKEAMGIDMRQDFTLGVLRGIKSQL